MSRRQTFRPTAVESLEDRVVLSQGLGAGPGSAVAQYWHLVALNQQHRGHHAPVVHRAHGHHGHGAGSLNAAQNALLGLAPSQGGSQSGTSSSTTGSSTSSPTPTAPTGTPTTTFPGLATSSTGPKANFSPPAYHPRNPWQSFLAATNSTPPAPASPPPTTTTTPAPTGMMAPGQSAPTGSAAMMPVNDPTGPIVRVTLTKDQVKQLQQAVDTFAANYTSGADATKDADAWKALMASMASFRASLQPTPPPVMTTTTPVTNTSTSATSTPPAPPSSTPPQATPDLVPKITLTPDQVKQLQQAVDTFAASYTSGADTAKDTAAWKALFSSLASVWPSQPGTPGMPIAPIWIGRGLWGGLHGQGLGDPALTKDQAQQLQQAVDTFTASYTAGADATKDAAAWKALDTSLTGLGVSLRGVPQPPASPPVPPGGPVMHYLGVQGSSGDTGSTGSTTTTPDGKA